MTPAGIFWAVGAAVALFIVSSASAQFRAPFPRLPSPSTAASGVSGAHGAVARDRNWTPFSAQQQQQQDQARQWQNSPPPVRGSLSGVLNNPSAIWGNDRPTSELWREISAKPDRPWNGRRPAVFSYVLSGQVGGEIYEGSDQRIVLARENMNALLVEIRSLGRAAPGRALDSVNLFCLPSVRRPNEGVFFDYGLAGEYREAFAKVLAHDKTVYYKLDRPGPFIIATTKPVNELMTSARSDALLIDLSDVDTKSVVVFLNEYKKHIRQTPVSGAQELSSWRGKIVSALLGVNAAVPFISNAYASAKVPGATAAPSLPGAASAPEAKPKGAKAQKLLKI